MRAQWLVIAAVVVAALVLRLADLGRVGFWHDETFHALAARSILQSGEPVIPPGIRYDRAWLYTQCVAVSFEALGQSEAAARLPSVLFNLVFMLLRYAIVQRILGFRVAAVFLGLLAVSPLDVSLSRYCRMYTLFELQYCSAAMCFFAGIEGRARLLSRYPAWLEARQKVWQVDVPFLLLSAALLFLSVQSHAFALDFGFVVLGYASCRLAMCCRRGQASQGRWKFLLIVAACLGGAAVLWLCTPKRLADLVHMAMEGQGWDRNLHFPVRYYAAYLRDSYSFVFFLLPLGLFHLWFRDRALSVFVGASFSILFLLHSVFYFTKLPRYLLYAMPFLLLASATALDAMLGWLLDASRRLTRDHGAVARVAGIGIGIATVAGLCEPMYASTREAMRMRWYFDYKVFYEEVGRFIPRDAVIVSTEWEDFCYYFGREPDYYLRRVYTMTDRDMDKRIATDTQLEQALATDQPVFLLTRLKRLAAGDFVSERMAARIADHFVEIGKSGEIRYFVDKEHQDLDHDLDGRMMGKR